MEYTIENKTILLPEIIAENAFWDAIEKSTIASNPFTDYSLQLLTVPYLVDRANHHFKENAYFRRKIARNNEAARDYLHTFMEHWAIDFLNKL